jgi:hypothetical protein
MNNNRAGISAMRSLAVPTAASTTVVSASQNPSYVMQTINLIATVTGSAGTPTGTVLFRDGGASLFGCETVPLNASGVATCSIATLSQGSHSITAVYSGTATYLPSTSAAYSQGVAAKVTPSVSLIRSSNPANAGVSITFTASVTGSSGVATGTITFRDNGSPISGCSSLTLSGGSAVCMTSTIPAGSHSITASYGGNAAYNAANSGELSQSVVVAPPGGYERT